MNNTIALSLLGAFLGGVLGSLLINLLYEYFYNKPIDLPNDPNIGNLIMKYTVLKCDSCSGLNSYIEFVHYEENDSFSTYMPTQLNCSQCGIVNWQEASK